MRYGNKKVDGKFYGEVTVIPQGEATQGYIWAPYILHEDIEIISENKIKMIESMTERQIFMKQYKEDHARCPNCGVEGNHTQTLTAFIFYNDRPEIYKDLNNCFCVVCQTTHKVHDRKPK